MLKTIIVCIIAGLGAGLGTGFAGLSAAVFISPMLVAFLDYPVYQAVGIALASDVLASAISSYNYGKAGNIDIKRGKTLFATVLLFTIIGSLIAFFITSNPLGNNAMGYISILTALFLGITFMIPKKEKEKREFLAAGRMKRVVIACGIYVGLVCGLQGAGGGMMLLIVMTGIMQFEFKPAIGTSVFIMTFTALIGAITHFVTGGMPDTLLLVLCVISTAVFAQIASKIANVIDNQKLRRVTGIVLVVSGVIMFVEKILNF